MLQILSMASYVTDFDDLEMFPDGKTAFSASDFTQRAQTTHAAASNSSTNQPPEISDRNGSMSKSDDMRSPIATAILSPSVVSQLSHGQNVNCPVFHEEGRVARGTGGVGGQCIRVGIQ